MTTQRENKLAAFFRSRSRSRSRPPPSDQAPSNPDSPPLPAHRLASRDASSVSDVPPSSYLKSSLRSQNRPISSTTTATHSTISPLPSDALRNRTYSARHAYAFHPHSTDAHTSPQDQCSVACDYDSDDNNMPRSETPSSTRRKLAWHSILGIPLTRRSTSSTSTPHHPSSTPDRKGSTSTSASEPKGTSSRKHLFRSPSRPTTPKSVDDSSKSPYSIPIPSSPLPLSASPRRRSFGLGSSQRTTPKSSTGHLPLPHVQTPPVGRSHGRRHSVGSERSPHDSAVALPEEPSHRIIHKVVPDGGGRNKGKERENLPSPPPDIFPSFGFPSQSLPPDPFPTSRDYLASQFPRYPVLSHLPTVDSVSSEENDQSSHRLHVIPQIIHTPPTPQRLGEVCSPSSTNTILPRVDSGKIEIAKGKAVAVTRREQVLVSSSQSHADVQHTTSSKGRFTPRFLTGKDTSKTKGDDKTSSRRPSPGSSDGPTHKTSGPNIIGPVRNMTSHRGKLGSFDFERPISALNRSNSTVNRKKTHIQTDNSPYSNARLHPLERTTSGDSAQAGKSRFIAHHSGQAESPMLSQLKPDHTGDTSVISFSSVSLQTKSTIGSNTPEGHSSSWGRSSGRRILYTSHGTFAFEHPPSLPSSPDPRAFNLPNGPDQNDPSEHTTGLPRSLPATPLHAIFDSRVKHTRGQSYNTPDEPSSSNPGDCKSRGKGRSLDLGLGLSWAPSRLREEILMPGLILTRERAKLDKNRANGSDVTKTFQSLLSESRFQTFKKYVRRFDSHSIPLEGPSGLLVNVEKLLAESGLNERERSKLMSEFTIFVKNHGG